MRILVVALLFALAGTASAQPAGWVEDGQHAAVIERDLRLGFPEGAQLGLVLSSFRSPTPGGQLIAWVLEVGVNGDGGGYVRNRIEDLRTTVDAMANSGSRVRTIAWSEKADPKVPRHHQSRDGPRGKRQRSKLISPTPTSCTSPRTRAPGSRLSEPPTTTASKGSIRRTRNCSTGSPSNSESAAGT